MPHQLAFIAVIPPKVLAPQPNYLFLHVASHFQACYRHLPHSRPWQTLRWACARK